MGCFPRACLLSLVTASCGGSGAFACFDDPSCSGGICQPNGYCSFEDPDCASGQRYGAHSPGDIAGECVDAGGSETYAETTIDPSTTLGTTTATTSGPSSDPSTDPSSDPSLTATGPDPPTDTTAAIDDTTAAIDESSSSSGAPPLLVCDTEEFDDEVFEDWAYYMPGPTDVFVDKGALVIDLVGMPSRAGIDGLTVGVAEGSIEVEMIEAPSQVNGTQMYLGIGLEDEGYLLMIEDGDWIVRYDELGLGFENLLELPWELEERWFRVVVEDGDLTFERSSDGMTWDTLTTLEPTFPLDEAQPYLHAGTWTNPDGPPGYAIFERISICTYQ